jgi:hypothetical protein
MRRTIEKLAHLSIIGIVILFFFIIYLSVPAYNLKIAISIALLIAAFVSCFLIFGELLEFLLVSFFLLMIVAGLMTRSLIDSLFFSSIVIVIIVLFNIFES